MENLDSNQGWVLENIQSRLFDDDQLGMYRSWRRKWTESPTQIQKRRIETGVQRRAFIHMLVYSEESERNLEMGNDSSLLRVFLAYIRVRFYVLKGRYPKNRSVNEEEVRKMYYEWLETVENGELVDF